MGQSPAAAHLASWAGMCPGTHESAGKRKGGKTRKGSRWRRATVVNAAHAAGRTKHTAVGARYRALVARRGKKRGAVAVGHTLLLIAYHVLRDHEPYDDLAHQPVVCPPAPHPHHLVQQVQEMGCDVTITPKAPAA